jgi:threonyl-tRNA synthetase
MVAIMVKVQLPDGSVQEYPDGSTSYDIAAKIGPRLAQACVAAAVDGAIVDLKRPLPSGQTVKLKLLTDRDPDALKVMRHSAAHVMARAVMRLFPDVGLAFGPTLPNGFYYDFDMPGRIREEDFPRIEKAMAEIIADAEPFDRFELPRDEALAFCTDLKQNLKVEHLKTGLADHPTLSFYRQGEFVDLCRGPHIPDASKIKAYKLMSVAASHFKGDASGRSLQRLYGTAFFSQKDLDAHLAQVEEAKRRDHRVLGKQHALFNISNDVGPGLCLWLPKGATVRGILEEFIKEQLLKRGYQPVYITATPSSRRFSGILRARSSIAGSRCSRPMRCLLRKRSSSCSSRRCSKPESRAIRLAGRPPRKSPRCAPGRDSRNAISSSR